MASKDDEINLTAKDLAHTFADPQWASLYPPVLTIDQAAALLQVKKETVYTWSSQGRLRGCCRKLGKHLRFFRDKLLIQAFNYGLNSHDKR
jgi:excisionase family DNA binding protein